MLDELVAFYGAEYEDNGGQRIDYTYGGNEGSIYIKNTDSNLPVGTLQKFLDKYLAEKDNPQNIIYKAMRYSVFAGGKRLRPILIKITVCKFNLLFQQFLYIIHCPHL